MAKGSRNSSLTFKSTCSKSSEPSSIWRKLIKLFQPHNKKRHTASISRPTSVGSTISDEYVRTISTDPLESTTPADTVDSTQRSHRRQRKQLIQNVDFSPPQMKIPPFSPTYCKANEFPYSNSYVKLPDGKWMINYRDGNREVLRTDIIESYLI